MGSRLKLQITHCELHFFAVSIDREDAIERTGVIVIGESVYQTGTEKCQKSISFYHMIGGWLC